MPKGKIEINKWKMPVKLTSQVKMKKMKVVAIRTEIETEMKEEEKTRMIKEKKAKMRAEEITKASEVEIVDKGTKEIEVIETETIKMRMLTITMEVTSARKRGKAGRELLMLMENMMPGAHRMKRTHLIIDPKLQNHKVAVESKEAMSIKQNLRKRESKSIDPEMMTIARKPQVVEAVDEEEASEMTINTLKMTMTIIIRNKSLT